MVEDISIDAYAVDVSTPRDSGLINGMTLMRVNGMSGASAVEIIKRKPACRHAGVLCQVDEK